MVARYCSQVNLNALFAGRVPFKCCRRELVAGIVFYCSAKFTLSEFCTGIFIFIVRQTAVDLFAVLCQEE
jgi:hypothetical protein